jgi:branched-chain amino acid aminotransferase
MNNVCFNGKLLPADTPLLRPDNKSYRYGDGLFETMRVVRGLIPLAHLHFERLFWGLRLLDFNIPSLITREKLQEEIRVLCKYNNCEKLARIRLSASRGNGSIYDGSDDLQYLIECWPLEASEKGMVISSTFFPTPEKAVMHFQILNRRIIFLMLWLHDMQGIINLTTAW